MMKVLRHAAAGAICAAALTGCMDDPMAPRLDARAMLPSADIAVDDFDGTIRIGVVPSATSVEIGAASAWELREKATGELLFTGSGDAAAVTIISNPTIDTSYRLQVSCTGDEAFMADWLARAAAAGYPTYTEFVPSAGCWRLRIGQFAVVGTFGVRVAFKNQMIDEGFAAADAFWVVTTVVEGETRLGVTYGGETVDAGGPVVLESTGETVTIGGAPYRGVAEVVVNSAGTLAGVNEVDLEQYLYGVVPRELPPTIWHQLEAQKAQAIAARTYALRGLGKRASDGYDLLPTTSDQVYGGFAAEHPLSTAAIDATAGMVATYDGALIEALFSSTSGGHTADNEEVFNSAPVPYLRGVPDSERGASEAVIPTVAELKRAGNPKSLRGFSKGDFEGDWSVFHRWTFEWTQAEIREVAADWAGHDVGAVLEINALQRGPSGRVTELQIVAEQDTLYAHKDAIRSHLRFFDADGVKRSLLSTLFHIEPANGPADAGAPTGFVAWGGGWGHGVGLSQTGAAGMAERGYTHDEILKHYYTGIELEQLSG